MAEFTGQSAYIKFGATVLSGDYRNFDEDEDVGLVDASAGSDTHRSYIKTLLDGKATAEIVAQAGGTLLFAAVKPGTEAVLEWGPEGNTTGKEKRTVTAVVLSRKRTTPYDNLVVITVEFQFQGAVADGTYI